MLKFRLISLGIQFLMLFGLTALVISKESHILKEIEAADYLKALEIRYSRACNKQMVARWAYITNVTDENAKASVIADNEYLEFQSLIQHEISQRFANWGDFKDHKLKREYRYISAKGPATTPVEDISMRNELLSKMETAYATATICEYKNPSNCGLHLDDISDKLASQTNYDELAYYYTAWHDAMNKAVKPSNYSEFVTYENGMAKATGFADMGEKWLDPFDDDDETSTWTAAGFKEEMFSIWEQIKPYYNKLHAYVRMKLRANPNYASKIKKYGYLPAHLLGNMWGQDWSALGKTTKPFPNVPSLDVTDAMIKKGYTPKKIFEEVDQFFTNLGLLPFTNTFWNKSMLERPEDREAVCHASAEDFCLGKHSEDFRIKQCTKVNMENLVTAHHEAGHIQYFMQYTNLDFIFRNGANPGFHEAIGDSLSLAVITPKHLQCVLNLDLGLKIDCANETNFKTGEITEADINYLYFTALRKFAFFPFAISMDSWRWEVFEGKITEDKYNERWWQLRQKNQGIAPPTERPKDAFDPAAKYHIVANVPYIIYFMSQFLQFQFYEAMCKASGEYRPGDPTSKPLYQCDFSGSREAGELLREVMKLGFSKPWPEALTAITGSTKLSIEPIINYFEPVFELFDRELATAGEVACFGADCQPLANAFLNGKYEEEISKMVNKQVVAEYAYNTDLNNASTVANLQAASLEYATFEKRYWLDPISQFDYKTFDDSDTVKRRLKFLNAIGSSALPEPEFVEFTKINAGMTKIYSTAKICPFSNQKCNATAEGLVLDPGANIFENYLLKEIDLRLILGNSTNYDEMAYIWKAWRDASGKLMREEYYKYINLCNTAAVTNGYKNMGDFWLVQYDSPTFRADMESLWTELRPMYEELHAYVRYKVSLKYPQVQLNEPIPAHLFGNMWSQAWDTLYPDLVPFPNAKSMNISKALHERFPNTLEGVTQMFDMANEFFLSLGLSDMHMAYGPKAVIMKPNDKEVVCHASAWDFSDGEDFRVKICTQINQFNFITIHHELGHIQYYINYRHQPYVFRFGANPGFHEAIGDAISLSVNTPKHMATIGFINHTESSNESALNYLLRVALSKVAFLPYGYLLDAYRWKVFDGSIPTQNLTYNWIKMTNEYQGIVPPVKRSENDFDAGAMHHVSANLQYIKYFVSNTLQFQLHKALCIEAGQYPQYPLHECDIYGNRKAGAKLKQILESGMSKDWHDLLQETTGINKLDGSAIKEYFAPIIKYLAEQRQLLGYPIGWPNTAFENYYE